MRGYGLHPCSRIELYPTMYRDFVARVRIAANHIGIIVSHMLAENPDILWERSKIGLSIEFGYEEELATATDHDRGRVGPHPSGQSTWQDTACPFTLPLHVDSQARRLFQNLDAELEPVEAGAEHHGDAGNEAQNRHWACTSGTAARGTRCSCTKLRTSPVAISAAKIRGSQRRPMDYRR